MHLHAEGIETQSCPLLIYLVKQEVIHTHIHSYIHICTRNYPENCFCSPISLSSTTKLFCSTQTSKGLGWKIPYTRLTQGQCHGDGNTCYDKISPKFTEFPVCSSRLSSCRLHTRDVQTSGAFFAGCVSLNSCNVHVHPTG